jgi:hypothetical protein
VPGPPESAPPGPAPSRRVQPPPLPSPPLPVPTSALPRRLLRPPRQPRHRRGRPVSRRPAPRRSQPTLAPTRPGRRERPIASSRGASRTGGQLLARPWTRLRPDGPVRPSPDQPQGAERADRPKRRPRPPSRPLAVLPAGPRADRAPRPRAGARPSAPARAAPSHLRPEALLDRPPAGRSPRLRGWGDEARPPGPGRRRAPAVPEGAAVPQGPAPAARADTELHGPEVGAMEAVAREVDWDAARCRRPLPDEVVPGVVAVLRSVGPVAAAATWRSSSRRS